MTTGCRYITTEEREELRMNNPHRCVIDRDGYYVTFVNIDHIPKSFALTDGQSYIEASLPSNMLKPRWINSDWREIATPEQVESAKPVPLPPSPPTEAELLAIETMMLIASIQEETMMALAELSMAIAQERGMDDVY